MSKLSQSVKFSKIIFTNSKNRVQFIALKISVERQKRDKTQPTQGQKSAPLSIPEILVDSNAAMMVAASSQWTSCNPYNPEIKVPALALLG